MNFKSFILSIIYLLCFINNILGQEDKLYGIVVDENNLAIQDASVVIRNSKDEILDYSFTNMNGKFAIKYNNCSNQILTISYIGFEKLIEKINSSNISEYQNCRTYVLKNSTTLNEIVVKPENIEQDTVNLDLKKLNFKENDNLGDMLKKNPNFKISKEGSIIYKGKSIDRILVDGKEFFNYQNSIALDKIENRMISKLQVVNNYRDKFTLDKDSPDETVINISSKDEFRNIFTGTVEGGYGVNNKFDFKGSVMRFSSLYNGFIINNTNNIGEPTFKLREIEQLFGKSKSMSSLFSDPINELFQEDNKSRSLTSNSNITFRKTNNNYKLNSTIYYINSDRQNILSSFTSYPDATLISQNDQNLNYDSNTLFTNTSFDYIITNNQMLNISFDGNFINANNSSVINALNANSVNDISTTIYNKSDNYSFFPSINYSNRLSTKILLSISANTYFENISLNNNFHNSINSIELFSQDEKYHKSNYNISPYVKYKIVNGVNLTVRGEYEHQSESLLSSNNDSNIRIHNKLNFKLNLSGQKLLKTINYDVSIGYQNNSIDYNNINSNNSFIPYSISVNYENRLNRLYFDSYYLHLINPLETCINILKSDNSVLLSNTNIPLSYMKLHKYQIGYSYNNVFIGNSLNLVLSYQESSNKVQKGFIEQDENGVYYYILFNAPISKEYKFSTDASKTLFKFKKYPIVFDTGISFNRLEFPIYSNNELLDSKAMDISSNIEFQSISSFLVNFDFSIDYTYNTTSIRNNDLKSHYLRSSIKAIFKKNNFSSELKYAFDFDRITTNNYSKQSISINAEYKYKKLIFCIDGNNIDQLLGLFSNTSYQTRYSVFNGINEVTIMNKSISYLLFKIKFNY